MFTFIIPIALSLLDTNYRAIYQYRLEVLVSPERHETKQLVLAGRLVNRNRGYAFCIWLVHVCRTYMYVELPEADVTTAASAAASCVLMYFSCLYRLTSDFRMHLWIVDDANSQNAVLRHSRTCIKVVPSVYCGHRPCAWRHPTLDDSYIECNATHYIIHFCNMCTETYMSMFSHSI